jgi:hypothetical protein
MDEGMNSFYEKKVDKIIDSLNAEKKEGNIQKLSKELNGNFIYQISAKQEEDQIINSPAASFTSINYGGSVYYKTAALFAYLESYLGTEIFNKAMQQYYETWKHKHPYPEDFKSIMEAVAGKKLDWFFEDGLNSTKKMDYKIKVKKKKNQYVISATNKKDFKGPIPINAMIKDSIAETQWIEYPYQNTVSFTDYDTITAYKIDGKKMLPELNITNNFYEKNLDSLLKSKNLVLNKYNFFNYAVEICSGLSVESPKKIINIKNQSNCISMNEKVYKSAVSFYKKMKINLFGH